MAGFLNRLVRGAAVAGAQVSLDKYQQQAIAERDARLRQYVVEDRDLARGQAVEDREDDQRYRTTERVAGETHDEMLQNMKWLDDKPTRDAQLNLFQQQLDNAKIEGSELKQMQELKRLISDTSNPDKQREAARVLSWLNGKDMDADEFDWKVLDTVDPESAEKVHRLIRVSKTGEAVDMTDKVSSGGTLQDLLDSFNQPTGSNTTTAPVTATDPLENNAPATDSNLTSPNQQAASTGLPEQQQGGGGGFLQSAMASTTQPAAEVEPVVEEPVPETIAEPVERRNPRQTALNSAMSTANPANKDKIEGTLLDQYTTPVTDMIEKNAKRAAERATTDVTSIQRDQRTPTYDELERIKLGLRYGTITDKKLEKIARELVAKHDKG